MPGWKILVASIFQRKHRLVYRLDSRNFLLLPPSTSADAQKKFVADFVKAWSKVMNLDRFDLA